MPGSLAGAGASAGAGLHRAARIVERVQENARTVSLVLEPAIDTSTWAAPGQFAMLWIPGMDEKPFSIAGADPLMFTISRVGPFSEALHGLVPGDTLHYRGPFGQGWTLGAQRALLIGGGYGAAPLAFLGRALLAAGAARVEAALGARSAADLMFVERFAALGIRVHAATEDGSAGTRGLVTDVAAPLLAAPLQSAAAQTAARRSGGFDRVCACGPEAMLAAVAALCRRTRVPAELSHEAYLRCGIGLCGACEHDGRLVCMDGPVFAAPAEA
jgi:dihydroorotate dehydrogenase electron transfer subunit